MTSLVYGFISMGVPAAALPPPYEARYIGWHAPGFLSFDSYMEQNMVAFETKENWSYVAMTIYSYL